MSLIVTPSGHGLGLVAGLRDKRDHPFRATRETITTLPKTLDKFAQVKSVFDQGQLGSCTGHGLVGGLRMLLQKQKRPDYLGSRLAAYFLGRVLENTVQSDAGAQIRDVIKAAANVGVVAESDWPYDIRQFRQAPPVTKAADHQVLSYQAIPNDITEMRRAIYERWHAIIGIAVYESFDSAAVAKSGTVPIPKPASEALLGWHCVYLVGWTATNFIGVNSWGVGWGKGGRFLLPNAFITDPDLCDDCWALSASE